MQVKKSGYQDNFDLTSWYFIRYSQDRLINFYQLVKEFYLVQEFGLKWATGDK